MSECKSCGKSYGLFQGTNGYCVSCFKGEMVAPTVRLLPVIAKRAQRPLSEAKVQKRQRIAATNAVLLTTETIPELVISERKGIVTSAHAFNVNVFKDRFAGVRRIMGRRSGAGQKTMRETRKVVLDELKKEAHAVGANAVVGVDLDYVELSSAGSMVLLVASGTAVVIEDWTT